MVSFASGLLRCGPMKLLRDDMAILRLLGMILLLLGLLWSFLPLATLRDGVALRTAEPRAEVSIPSSSRGR